MKKKVNKQNDVVKKGLQTQKRTKILKYIPLDNRTTGARGEQVVRFAEDA